MKYALFVGLACAALATGCASSLPTSAVATTSASVPVTGAGTSRASSAATPTAAGVKNETRVASRRPESSLRNTAAQKSRCESGDDSACLVAGSFER